MKANTLASIFGDTVMLDLQADDKKGILKQLVEAACGKAEIGKKLQSKLLSKVMAREELGSTGIGAGASVPHAKVKGVKNILGVFARSREAIDYDAVDGEPVRLFFLLISPEDGAEGYLEALSSLSRALRDKKFCNFLMTASTKKEVNYTLGEIPLTPLKGA